MRFLCMHVSVFFLSKPFYCPPWMSISYKILNVHRVKINIAPLTFSTKLNGDVVFHPRRLVAPIASLDCMEEFSGNTLDLSKGNFGDKIFTTSNSMLNFGTFRTLYQSRLKSIAQKCIKYARWTFIFMNYEQAVRWKMLEICLDVRKMFYRCCKGFA